MARAEDQRLVATLGSKRREKLQSESLFTRVRTAEDNGGLAGRQTEFRSEFRAFFR